MHLLIMPFLIQLTTDYSIEEDRIRLTGRDETECIYILWLTRRLADRLFHASVDWLEKQKAAHVGSNLVQTFEQEHAVGEIEPQARVSTSTESSTSTCLVNNVDINSNVEGIILIFKDTQNQSISVAFQTIELRQWLSICSKVYQTAEWSLEIWPSWMVNGPAGTRESMGVLVH